MASYNHELFVADSVRSVLDQTYKNFEFIIVDDGSKDQTVNKIKKFNDTRIHLTVLEKNQGACVATNLAISKARGKYIAVINSDDKFLPNKLEKQLSFLETHPSIGAVFGIPQFIDERGAVLRDDQHFYGDLFKKPNRSRYEWLNFFFYHGNALCHPTVMIRGECYQDLGYYNPWMAQCPDFDFWIRLALKYQIHVMHEDLIQYRILDNEKNVSAVNPSSTRRSYWEWNKTLENFLKINSFAELKKIFPELPTPVENDDPDLIKFYVAQVALNIQSPYRSLYYSFGLKVMHELISNEVSKYKINRAFGFKESDFIKLTGEKDIYKTS